MSQRKEYQRADGEERVVFSVGKYVEKKWITLMKICYFYKIFVYYK